MPNSYLYFKFFRIIFKKYDKILDMKIFRFHHIRRVLNLTYSSEDLLRLHKDSGNAVIWALLAVALFAMLGAAVMSGSRSSTNIVSGEEARAYARQIIAYGNDVKGAVQRLKFRGCDDNEISFENDVYFGSTSNPRAPENRRCHVFAIEGGGLKYWAPSEKMLSDTSVLPTSNHTQFRGYTAFIGASAITDYGSNDSAEILMVIPWLDSNICMMLNEMNGVGGVNEFGVWMNEHIGPFLLRESPQDLSPKTFPSYCSERNDNNARAPYTYHHMLLAR